MSVVPIWACRLAGSNQYLETGTLAITQGCIYFGKIWSVWQINDSLYVYGLCNIKYFYHGLEMGEEWSLWTIKDTVAIKNLLCKGSDFLSTCNGRNKKIAHFFQVNSLNLSELHRGRNQRYSFHRLFGRPWGHYGCKKFKKRYLTNRSVKLLSLSFSAKIE